MMFRRLLKFLGYGLIRISEARLSEDALDLSGDRDVEWAWVAGNLPEHPGRLLDFGPATSPLGLAAAFHNANVTGLDLEAPPVLYRYPRLVVRRGDILEYDFGGERFDTIINCSTIEHVGLRGRYGSADLPDGDLRAMRRLHELMAGPKACMVMTVPVGRDGTYAPAHRVYGPQRLPRLLKGFTIRREAYFAKLPGDRRWQQTSRDAALAVEGSSTFYALGLFVLAPA